MVWLQRISKQMEDSLAAAHATCPWRRGGGAVLKTCEHSPPTPTANARRSAAAAAAAAAALGAPLLVVSFRRRLQ